MRLLNYCSQTLHLLGFHRLWKNRMMKLWSTFGWFAIDQFPGKTSRYQYLPTGTYNVWKMHFAVSSRLASMASWVPKVTCTTHLYSKAPTHRLGNRHLNTSISFNDTLVQHHTSEVIYSKFSTPCKWTCCTMMLVFWWRIITNCVKLLILLPDLLSRWMLM